MPISRQRGAALLALLAVVLAVGAAMVLHNWSETGAHGRGRKQATARSLADAKRALVAWAVTVPTDAGRLSTPGRLPFPDRHRDGNYDGRGDCVTFGLSDAHLLGRFPWAGDARPCPRIGLHVDVRDAAGHVPWYAVSRNLVTNGGGGPINPDMGEAGAMRYPWLVVRDARGVHLARPGGRGPLPVAAVIIAPGDAVADQDRSSVAPPPADFLDRVIVGGTTYDNADADGCTDAVTPPCAGAAAGEEFILQGASPPGDSFNDRLTYIAVDELVGALEKRVLGELAIALGRYRDAYGVYPWLHGVRTGAAPSFESNLSRDGRLAVHLERETFETRFETSWRLVDVTPTTTTRHSGDVRLVPPLADAMTGTVDVPHGSGHCRWSDATRGDCAGARQIAAHYRADLGRTVHRITELVFDIVDMSPEVTPPSVGDVRRRALSVTDVGLPTSSATSFDIRITDTDGVDVGIREFTIDVDTVGAVHVSGIRYELSVVYDGVADARDELPEWFVVNEWHHFVHAAFSTDAVAGGNDDGDGDCATPKDNCLSLILPGRSLPRRVRALLIAPGVPLPDQGRTIGDCDGDGRTDAYLCAYFEGDNGDRSTAITRDTYRGGSLTARFNDQVRVIDPPAR